MLILYYFDASLPVIVIVSMTVALIAVFLYRWWKLYPAADHAARSGTSHFRVPRNK
jgi:hypothetical protein